MSLRPSDPRAAKAATVRRKLKRAGRVARTRQGLRPLQPSVAALDALWAKCIKARDGGKCRRCGKTSNLQAAHLRSRRYHSTRWALWNGIALCAGDHLWAHGNPLEFAAWIAEQGGSGTLGPQGFAPYGLAAFTSSRRVDRALTLLELEAEARKLGL